MEGRDERGKLCKGKERGNCVRGEERENFVMERWKEREGEGEIMLKREGKPV